MYKRIARARLWSVMGVALLGVCCTQVMSQGHYVAQTRTRPAYPPAAGACYIQLRPSAEFGRSDKSPVCRTVLQQLNESCNEPPLYEVRHFKPSAQGLRLPDWKPLDASDNLDILEWSLDPYGKEKAREFRWKKEEEHIRAEAKTGTVRLLRADVDGINPRGGIYTVYRAENLNLARLQGYNQAKLVFSEQGERAPSSLFRAVPRTAPWGSDLLGYGNDWFLFGFDPDYATFFLDKLSMPIPAPVGTVTVCAFQHISDRKAEK